MDPGEKTISKSEQKRLAKAAQKAKEKAEKLAARPVVEKKAGDDKKTDEDMDEGVSGFFSKI